jgi:hypothetical protein
LKLIKATKSGRTAFPEGSSLAAFVVGPEGETLFVGKLQSELVLGAYKDYFEGHGGKPSNLTTPLK